MEISYIDNKYVIILRTDIDDYAIKCDQEMKKFDVSRFDDFGNEYETEFVDSFYEKIREVLRIVKLSDDKEITIDRQHIQDFNKLKEYMEETMTKAGGNAIAEMNNEEHNQADVRKPETAQNKPETLLANQVSIMDFVKKNNYVITHEDDKIAKIKDILTEEEITVFKENNTWSISENGTTTGGRTIRFVARMQEMTSSAASDMLVENRAKYQSSREYNEEYAKQHSKQVEAKSEPIVKREEAVKKQEDSQEKVQEGNKEQSSKAETRYVSQGSYRRN